MRWIKNALRDYLQDSFKSKQIAVAHSKMREFLLKNKQIAVAHGAMKTHTKIKETETPILVQQTGLKNYLLLDYSAKELPLLRLPLLQGVSDLC